MSLALQMSDCQALYVSCGTAHLLSSISIAPTPTCHECKPKLRVASHAHFKAHRNAEKEELEILFLTKFTSRVT